MNDNDLAYAQKVIARNTPKKYDLSSEESKDKTVVICAFRGAYYTLVRESDRMDISGIMNLLMISEDSSHRNAYSEGVENIYFRRIVNHEDGPSYNGIDFDILYKLVSLGCKEIINLNKSYKLPDFEEKLCERFNLNSLDECIVDFCNKYISQEDKINNGIVDRYKAIHESGAY